MSGTFRELSLRLKYATPFYRGAVLLATVRELFTHVMGQVGDNESSN